MESGFKNPISIKKQNPKDNPKDAKNTWWDCQQPQYDQRSSCFVNTGTHYGVGHKQPVGRLGDPKTEVPTLPMNKDSVNSMEIDEVG